MIVILVSKSGKDTTNPTNYCYCRLVWYLESHKLLTNGQCRFRSRCSMVDHLFRFEPFSREAFIHYHHLILVGGFIWRNRTTLHGRMSIMRDLHGFGLHGRLPNFINNFLKDRSFKEGSLFNDTLNTFYLRLHGVRTILIVRKETSCRHIGYSFLLTTRVL